jgi:integrase
MAQKIGPMSVKEAWGHFQANELRDADINRSPTTTQNYEDNFRNQMSVLFSHCIRHELYEKLNLIASVRQGAGRERDPDVLTLEEMKSILSFIESSAVSIMVQVAAASALLRSEFRGLKWEDVDLENCWFHCRRGLVNKHVTKMNTNASRKSVEMNPNLAEALLVWRDQTLYNQDSDWVFAPLSLKVLGPIGPIWH